MMHRSSISVTLFLVVAGLLSSANAAAGAGAGAGGSTDHRHQLPPPPPPPPPPGLKQVSTSAAEDGKSSATTKDAASEGVSSSDGRSTKGAGGGSVVMMPPPPPPPPPPFQSHSGSAAGTGTAGRMPIRESQGQQQLQQQAGRPPPPRPPPQQQQQQQQPQPKSQIISPSAATAQAAVKAAGITRMGKEGDFQQRLTATLGQQKQKQQKDQNEQVRMQQQRRETQMQQRKEMQMQHQQRLMHDKAGTEIEGRRIDEKKEETVPEQQGRRPQLEKLQSRTDINQHQMQQQNGNNGWQPARPQASWQSQQHQQQNQQQYTMPQQQQQHIGAGRRPLQQQRYQQRPPHPIQQERPRPMQQQRQQQQMPRPQQPRQQAPRLFNGLLRRMEKGLDAVASIEDIVDRRARAIGRTVKYATTGKMSVKEAAEAAAVGSRQGFKEVRRAERVARQAPNMFDLFKDDIKAAEEQIAEAAEAEGEFEGSAGTNAAAEVNGGLNSLPAMAAPWGEAVSRGDKVLPGIGQDVAASLLSNGGATNGNGGADDNSKSQQPQKQQTQEQQQPSPMEQLFGQQPSKNGGTGASKDSEPSRKPISSYLNYDDDDDSHAKSLKGRFSKALRSLPNPAKLIPSWGRDSAYDLTGEWSDDDDEGSWGADIGKERRRAGSGSSSSPSVVRPGGRSSGSASQKPDGIPASVNQLLGRGDSRTGESGFNLLSRQEGYRCHRLGRTRSLFDVAALVFLLFVIGELAPYIASAITEASTVLVRGHEGDIPVVYENIRGWKQLLKPLYKAFSAAFEESWAPLALASAFLSVWSNDVFVRPAVRRTASAVSGVVRDQASYSQMFLRLVAALPPRKNVPEVLDQSARRQVWSDVEATRLRSFVGVAVIALIALTISVAKPILFAIVRAGADIVALQGWKSWPPQWGVVGEGMKAEFSTLGHTLGSLLGNEWEKIVANPMGIVVQGSLFVALIAASTLPTLVRHIEQKKSNNAQTNIDATVKAIGDDEEERDSERSTATVLDMGISSSTRLSLLSQTGAVEGTLERWRLMQPKSRPSSTRRGLMNRGKNGGGAALLRRAAYEAFTAALLSLPVILYFFVVPSTSVTTSERWSTGVRLVTLLFVTYGLTRNVMSAISDEFNLTSSVSSFLGLLAGTVDEIAKTNQSPHADLQLVANASPSKGLSVTDFWAAHSARSAWACRGAQLSCQNGEVCLVLGDDGGGKSRLLTALAESIVLPPSKSRSTVTVRGNVSVGGVDVTRWDKRRLKRSLGLVLNDVRTLSDTAELLSGCTLEEILDPGNGGGGGYGSRSHNAMQIAMQVTGLSTGLVARLPSKLSTVVTANEDELSPSPIRPSAQILSPSEWSKVLLTRAIAQAVFSNENSSDAVQSSLIGSLLLLDDVTKHVNEVEEAALIKSLRSTGAAVLLASNHWASGRFVDRIVVMKEGAVVESGTHAELLKRGPAASLYALKWKQMTSAS